MSALGWRDDPEAVDTDDALVLLPSLGTTSRLFDDLVAGLESRLPALAIVRADLPGHGTGNLRDGFTIPALAEEVVQAIERMNARAVTVVGVSMGGAIAFEAARRRPARLRGFAMINSGLRFGSAENWQRLIDTVVRAGMEGTVPGAAAGWFASGFASSPRARSLLADIPGIDPSTYIACCRALAGYDGRDAVVDLGVPALLIGTSDDQATPPTGLRGLARLLPTADYFELPAGGHLSLVEHSVAVETILAHALSREDRHAA